MSTDASKPGEGSGIIEYARPSPCNRPKTRAILAAWLLPAGLQLLGWVILFRRFPGESPLDYIHDWLGGLAGVPLFIGAMLGLISTNSTTAFLALTLCSWSAILTIALVSSVRQLPLAAHWGLSCFWSICGVILFLGLAA